MIDSHSAAALVNSATASKFGNDTSDDQYNDIDNDEDEEFIINTNSNASNFTTSNRRQFVELEEDEEELDRSGNHAKPNFIEENESSSSSLSPVPLSGNNFDLNKNKTKKEHYNFISDTEIETINNAKTTNNNSNNNRLVEQTVGEPAFKRMRTSPSNNLQLQTQLVQQPVNVAATTVPLVVPPPPPPPSQIQPLPQQQQAQHHSQIQSAKIKELRPVNSQTNMSNMFLNESNNLGLLTSETNSPSNQVSNSNSVILDDQQQQQLNSLSSVSLINTPPLSMSNTQTNSPIISMPASPNLVNKNTNLATPEMISNK